MKRGIKKKFSIKGPGKRSKFNLSSPKYFEHVKISVTALVKMINHVKSGGDLEVMGLMQGKVIKKTFYILDSFALPIVGTETRVVATSETSEWIT